MVCSLSIPQRSLDPMAPLMNGNAPRSARTISSPVHLLLRTNMLRPRCFPMCQVCVTLLPKTSHSQYTIRLGHFSERNHAVLFLLSVCSSTTCMSQDMDVHINPTSQTSSLNFSCLAKIRCLVITIPGIKPYFYQWVPLHLNGLGSPCCSNDSGTNKSVARFECSRIAYWDFIFLTL